MFRAVLLLCALLSAGLVSGPADARSRDRSTSNDTEQRDDDRGEKSKKSRKREDRDDDRSDERKDERRSERREGDWIDRREAAKDAARLAQMRNGGGQVLSVDPIGNGHRVKVMKDGVVRVYIVEDQ